jgi:hypothetical protein
MRKCVLSTAWISENAPYLYPLIAFLAISIPCSPVTTGNISISNML